MLNRREDDIFWIVCQCETCCLSNKLHPIYITCDDTPHTKFLIDCTATFDLFQTCCYLYSAIKHHCFSWIWPSNGTYDWFFLFYHCHCDHYITRVSSFEMWWNVIVTSLRLRCSKSTGCVFQCHRVILHRACPYTHLHTAYTQHVNSIYTHTHALNYSCKWLNLIMIPILYSTLTMIIISLDS